MAENNRKVTVDMLTNYSRGMEEINDARFLKQSDAKALAKKDEVAKTDLSSALQDELNGKAASATTLAGYGIENAYTKAEVDAKVAGSYKYKGTKTFAELTSALLVTANVGNVYNISDAFTSTADFAEGAGKKHAAGVNVAIADVGTDEEPSYKFDVLGGTFNGYATTDDVEAATAADIQAILSGAYGGSSSGDENEGD